MGLFNRKNKAVPAKSGASVIAFGVSIKGELTAEGKLFVDGEFEGTIRSSGIVTIGESGRVKGELYASLLIVSGSFEGRAECENCEILKEGRVKGEIISDSLVIENGGRFEGFNTLRDTVRAKQETLEA